MTATTSTGRLLLRLIAPLVWRSEAKVAAKLEGFASTEAGSALDMLKAAELTDDPTLRRLFFRHAMDEARHAQLFRESARQLLLPSPRPPSEYNLIHATRQNLFERLGLVRFVAFVYLAEKRGELQFRALREHFRHHPALEALFLRVSRDEQAHIAYTDKLLSGWKESGQRGMVRRALWHVRLTRAWTAWRRSGRVFGDALSRLLLGILYWLVLPPFALLSRLVEPERAGWQRRTAAPASLESARRQF